MDNKYDIGRTNINATEYVREQVGLSIDRAAENTRRSLDISRLSVEKAAIELTKLRPHKGLFIVFEGGEGSGKTTQAGLLHEALKSLGYSVVLTREPGDTELGVKLRNILLDTRKSPLVKKAELFLFLADRAQHVEEVVKPALQRGSIVICDRYEASAMAYQVHAGGLPQSMVRTMSDWATDGLTPDVAFFLDVDPEKGLARAGRAGMDRYEQEQLSFHNKVRSGFLYEMTRSAEVAKTWVMIERDQTVATVQRKIYLRVMGVLEGLHFKNPRRSSEPLPMPCPVCETEMTRVSQITLHYTCPNGHGRMVFRSNTEAEKESPNGN
jgi:dTMP kinase